MLLLNKRQYMQVHRESSVLWNLSYLFLHWLVSWCDTRFWVGQSHKAHSFVFLLLLIVKLCPEWMFSAVVIVLVHTGSSHFLIFKFSNYIPGRVPPSTLLYSVIPSPSVFHKLRHSKISSFSILSFFFFFLRIVPHFSECLFLK